MARQLALGTTTVRRWWRRCPQLRDGAQRLRRRLEIRHLWTRPYTPRTKGKAERSIRTCLEREAHAAAYRTSLVRALLRLEWLRDCSHKRPHTALGFKTPVQRLAESQ